MIKYVSQAVKFNEASEVIREVAGLLIKDVIMLYLQKLPSD